MNTELIPDFKKDALGRRRGTKREEEVNDGMIVRSETLLQMMQDFIKSNRIPKKVATEATEGEYRTWDKWEKFPLRDVSGNVTAEVWGKMLKGATKGMLKTITNSQNNGDWQMLDAQAAITVDEANQDVLVLSVRWVDLLNQPQIRYAGGQPLADVTVNNVIPTEVTDALARMGGDGGGDPELKGLLKDLIKVMAAQNGVAVAPTPVEAEANPFPSGNKS
jgi:hypothetical protein